MTSRQLKIATLSLVLCAYSASAVQAVLLSDLIANNGTIRCSDKIFSNFDYAKTGDNPTPDRVDVSCITDGSGNHGIRYSGGFADFAANGASDALFTYKVSIAPGSPNLINDVHLAFNGDIVGSGFVGVTETFLPTDPNVLLSVYNLQPGGFQLTDWADLTQPVRELWVQKDLILFAAPDTASFASVSFIDQTFSQIPEPGSILLTALGLALGAAFRRR